MVQGDISFKSNTSDSEFESSLESKTKSKINKLS